jgi:hypothetical protein
MASVIVNEQVKFCIVAFEIVNLAVEKTALDENFSGVILSLNFISQSQSRKVLFENL